MGRLRRYDVPCVFPYKVYVSAWFYSWFAEQVCGGGLYIYTTVPKAESMIIDEIEGFKLLVFPHTLCG